MSSDAVGTLALIVFATVLAVAVYQLTSARRAGHRGRPLRRLRTKDSHARDRQSAEWERTTWSDKEEQG